MGTFHIFAIFLLTLITGCGNPNSFNATSASRGVSSSGPILTWDSNTENNVSGYRVYIGTTSGQYEQTIDVGNTTTFRPSISSATIHYFAVTAINSLGMESDKSNEVIYK